MEVLDEEDKFCSDHQFDLSSYCHFYPILTEMQNNGRGIIYDEKDILVRIPILIYNLPLLLLFVRKLTGW